ncbi:MGMT family protein [Bifidobacterium pullorum subsp. saeculare]|nr:MGMT family protein [Bifidobacterium pullorum]MBM6696129.1 MGMT family protein [Bifidobacterium pullorum subsp. saeculare]
MSESLVPDGAQGGALASEDAGRTQSFNAGVYEVVRRIPRGCVATYGQVAALAGRPRAARLVGFALHANPEPGVIPCHRVVFRDGSLAPGFAFGGEERQRELLEAEGVVFVPPPEGAPNAGAEGWRVDMGRCQWRA